MGRSASAQSRRRLRQWTRPRSTRIVINPGARTCRWGCPSPGLWCRIAWTMVIRHAPVSVDVGCAHPLSPVCGLMCSPLSLKKCPQYCFERDTHLPREASPEFLIHLMHFLKIYSTSDCVVNCISPPYTIWPTTGAKHTTRHLLG